eukprot:TRINITY_DN3830_c0_g1_i1.p1 TRINITY_DN3830_c0_g1~~TRINITY_DN3830_c0_g1_i1.p1  ORF type:complete len:117 (+),score=15.84 TRINITY_DN3830_c0_g1_i1:142-492(+)
MCSVPKNPSYTGNKKCNRGHKPWPYGVCLNCAPPTAHLRVQNYRHCDNIALPGNIIRQFYKNWMSSGGAQNVSQSAALLYGNYVEEPTETKNAGAIRAEVETVHVFQVHSSLGNNF